MERVARAAVRFGLLLSLAGCGSSVSDAAARAPDPVAVKFALTRQDTFAADGTPSGSFAYVYSAAGNLEREDEIGSTANYSTFEYDPTGAVVTREKRYGANDMLDTEIDYTYDQGVLVDATSTDASGAMLAYESYVFSDGKKVSATRYEGTTVTTVQSYTFSYDAQGDRLASTAQMGGAVTGSSVWHYASDGSPESIELIAADGTSVSDTLRLTTVSGGSNYDYFAFWNF